MSFSEVPFIDNFYPIYPILNHISCLYTDINSIGYDFLAFDRPLFFTMKNSDALHACGKEVEICDPYQHLKDDEYKEKRAEAYTYTFSLICKSGLQL